MKKWLPYVIAVVLGVGVAVLAFGPGSSGKGKGKKAPEEKQLQGPTSYGDQGSSVISVVGDTRTPADVVADGKAHPLPEPGTLRPLNQSEIDQAAKLARPFNKHYAYVAAFWNRAAQLVGPTDKELLSECSAMAKYLRDQGRLADADLDPAAVIAKEKALTTKIRGSVSGNSELDGVLNYIDASGQAVLDGNDPTTVPKPAKPASTTAPQ
jgi:hypothetical protein